MNKIHFTSLKTWIFTWKTFPVFSWIRAAECYRQGHFSEAILLYRKGLERHKNHPARHCATIDLARCLSAEGRIEEAEQCLRHLVVQIPSSHTAHKMLFLFQLRAGQSLDAAWTIRRAFRHITAEPELVGLYLFCVVENGGPTFLMKEALQLANTSIEAGKGTPLMKAAKQRLTLETKGYSARALKRLESLVDEEPENIEIALLAAEALLRAGKIASCRRVLRTALCRDPSHPRVLSLFAESYIRSGSFYRPEFAQQLAVESCKRTSWKSPREMHVLAEVFFHVGDTLSALATAERAREEGSRLLGTYRDSAALERLIDALHEDMNTDTPAAA